MYYFFNQLLQPYPLLYLLTGWAIVRLWRRGAGRGRLWAASLLFLTLAALSVPVVSYMAVGTLEWAYPPTSVRPPAAEAIIVLDAGVRPPNRLRSEPEMGPDTLYRCLHVAKLYRQGPAIPVLVSGGKVDPEAPGPPAAEVMRDFLIQLGIPASDLTAETASRTTYENAVECRKWLAARGLRTVVLVTDAVDARRAGACFRKQGVEAIPSPSHYRATQLDYTLFDWLPSPSAARNMQRVFHEWVGILWYRLHGRI